MKKLNIKQWDGENALTCYEALSDQPYALFFDSNNTAHALNNFSIICWNPVETITAKNRIITHNNKTIADKDVFSFIQTRLDQYNFKSPDNNLPFTGGAAGYFGYDLARGLEDISNKTIDDINIPDMMIGIYTNVIIFNHRTQKSWIITACPKEEKLLKLRITEIQKTAYTPPLLNWKTEKSDKDYKNNIQKIIDDIYAGEVYQVNLSRRFEAKPPEDFNSFTHYKHLRKINPAPFSSYMNFGQIKLSSCSPERFLKTEGKNVETRPIKGTLPSSLPSEQLKQSKKDRAENTMIVDLLRNDLSKVCDYHSVKVPELCALETFEGLHHLVSTIKGTLKKNKTSTDLLRACFPGGSITGAPKIRAMKIIENLETYRRSAYCGAMGYIDFNGNMDTNITIRTLIYANKTLYLQTGGGIVSDSVPEDELQESLDKADKIFESFKNNKEN